MLHSTEHTNRYRITDTGLIKQKVLNVARQFSTFCFLDNQQYQGRGHRLDFLLAAGKKNSFRANAGDVFPAFDQWAQTTGWKIGHFNYELKNEWHHTGEHRSDPVGFADACFFEPEILFRVSGDELVVECGDASVVVNLIQQADSVIPEIHLSGAPLIRSRYTREEYIRIIQQLRQHIHRGDCYEINFCQEFYAENLTADPFALYQQLVQLSPNPFSALYRQDDQWLICASPERFLQKTGNRLISQPIKGTAPRQKAADTETVAALASSAKDLAENVMVVDLVRNDLSRVCTEGSVQADELFGIYSFPQVHQMISTVSGEMQPDISYSDLMKALFPMGSMTGAPKEKVMELIHRYEKTRRGLFSGTLGYIRPDGDFDFNVVIRSILYNASTGYVSFPAGSGITWYSDPEAEWEECMVKLKAIRQVLGAAG